MTVWGGSVADGEGMVVVKSEDENAEESFLSRMVEGMVEGMVVVRSEGESAGKDPLRHTEGQTQ